MQTRAASLQSRPAEKVLYAPVVVEHQLLMNGLFTIPSNANDIAIARCAIALCSEYPRLGLPSQDTGGLPPLTIKSEHSAACLQAGIL
jgi:hypothetical protein